MSASCSDALGVLPVRESALHGQRYTAIHYCHLTAWIGQLIMRDSSRTAVRGIHAEMSYLYKTPSLDLSM